MKSVEVDDNNQNTWISLPAFINSLHHKIIFGLGEKLKFIRYVSNSHQITLEECPTAQSTFTG